MTEDAFFAKIFDYALGNVFAFVRMAVGGISGCTVVGYVKVRLWQCCCMLRMIGYQWRVSQASNGHSVYHLCRW